MDNLSSYAALLRINSLGINANTIIDVGASDGRWTKSIIDVYPKAFYTLLEANKLHKANLENLKAQHNNIDYKIGATGDYTGEIKFFPSGPLSGSVFSRNPEDKFDHVPIITLDELINENKYKPPFFLKISTNGFELPVIKGAEKTLKNTKLLVIESYNIAPSNGTLKFFELCLYMETLDFRCFGLADPVHKPSVHTFCQCKLLFISSSHDVFNSNSYN